MFKTPLSEKTKREIARLFQETNTSVEEIATMLNVSARSVQNYKNYGYEDAEKPMMSMPEPTQIKTPSSKRRQWLCKTPECGFVTDRQGVLCPRCQRGPFASCFVEIGTPEYYKFINQGVEHEEKLKEEVYDPTKDYWVCSNSECDYISNIEFKKCPRCGCTKIVFAPDGVEPRDSSKYQDSTRFNNEESYREDNGGSSSASPKNENETEEKKEEEFDWECIKCHYKFNGRLPDRCPKCGMEIEEPWECPKCHHQWYGDSDRCPSCGYKPGFF